MINLSLVNLRHPSGSSSGHPPVRWLESLLNTMIIELTTNVHTHRHRDEYEWLMPGEETKENCKNSRETATLHTHAEVQHMSVFIAREKRSRLELVFPRCPTREKHVKDDSEHSGVPLGSGVEPSWWYALERHGTSAVRLMFVSTYFRSLSDRFQFVVVGLEERLEVPFDVLSGPVLRIERVFDQDFVQRSIDDDLDDERTSLRLAVERLRPDCERAPV